MSDEYKSMVAEAVRIAGGPVKTAQLTGAPSYQAVQQWVAQEQVPAEYCKSLEKASGISCIHLNKKAVSIWPDLASAA
jgi:DNA-binding transcriptional regulator YdaS (Cro superfamily)